MFDIKRARTLAVLGTTLALLGFPACGDDSPTGTGGGASVLSFTFDDGDDEGFDFGTTSIDWGKAGAVNKDGGCIELDGVGDSDPGPNAWASREMALPANAAGLRFQTSPHNRGSGTGFLRVRLRDAGGTWHEILALEKMTGNEDEDYEWEERNLDISAWAGQTVLVQFELEDMDGGGNNQRVIDDVEVLGS